MVRDVVRELGYLTLGSRLKRIGERLQGQAQALLEARHGGDVDVTRLPAAAVQPEPAQSSAVEASPK